MAVPGQSPRISRRVLVVVGLGVALPAILLAGLGIFLSLRIARAVEDDSARYDRYIAQQVGETFERELLAVLKRAGAGADNAARANADTASLVAALGAGDRQLEEPWFVPESEITGMTAIIVESTPLLYAREDRQHRGLVFVGQLLHRADGQLVGVGGWWLDPRRFLLGHLEDVVQDRLPENPRLYGGIVSTRRLSIALLGPAGEELRRVRDPGYARSARTEPLGGPFEGYAIRVAPALGAPAVWATSFVVAMITFIALAAAAMLLATFVGLRYAVRQLELAHLKSSFVSNVTHELKTPIALIRLAAETLELRRFRSTEEGESFLRSIVRETVRLQQLVDNILDFARLEAGRATFRFEAVDLVGVVRDTVDAYRPRLEQHGFQIHLDLPEGLPPVRGDAMMLQHCVLNLLDNALKYSRTRREVEVSAEARDGAVGVSVRDYGIGIAAADQKRIFEKFVRVETGLVHDVKGAGLGLSLVEQIMRAHGGRVEVESSPGEGSTFTLVLPRAEGTQAPRMDRRTGT